MHVASQGIVEAFRKLYQTAALLRELGLQQPKISPSGSHSSLAAPARRAPFHLPRHRPPQGCPP